MLHKTRGIVFRTTKFSESSVIAKIFTEDFGLQSFMVNSVRSKNAKTKAASLLPLTIIEAIVYIRETREVQKISDVKICAPFHSIHSDIRKTSIVLFLADILHRTIKEESPNKKLFEYLVHSLLVFDIKNEGINSFHLFFLIHLTKHLGFFPSGNYSAHTPVFNLPEGNFQQDFPIHPEFISFPETEFISRLINSTLDSFSDVKIPKETRSLILEKLITYYRIHIPSINEIRSHKILEEVMN